jgi:hypothetical protein
MSTRCQVQVIESQEGEEYKITLYHRNCLGNAKAWSNNTGNGP